MKPKTFKMNLKKFNLFKNSPTTTTNELVQLVTGTFGPAEAADVLLSLINYKIKFHSVQILNLQDHETEAIEKSEKRIEELKIAKQKMTQLILDARSKGQNLEIDSVISISLKD